MASTAVAKKKSKAPPAGTRNLRSFISTEWMKREDWEKIPGCQRQRDTESRIATKCQHLREFQLTHASVSVARLPDGSMFKLDAHCRCEIWRRGLSDEVPEEVKATIYELLSEREVRRFYTHFDNRKAVETSRDQIFGALRENGVELQTRWMRTGGFKSALWLAVGNNAKREIYDSVALYASELQMLDSLRPDNKLWVTPVTAAALMTLRQNAKQAMVFWKQFQDVARMRKDQGGYSAPAMVRKYLDAKRAASKGAVPWASSGGMVAATRVILAIFETWLKNPSVRFRTVVRDSYEPNLSLPEYRERVLES